ncbi:MAG: hypothetical protein HC927_05660 [Deltaproteobacteria bacterium]|nr:hypothetical protein [Deltaproteobacteria bacterium]
MLRGERVFHPRGIYFRAQVEPVAGPDAQLNAIAQGLAQDAALVRLSSALYDMERGTLPDLLGCSIRFNVPAGDEAMIQPSSQDLLLATSPNVWMLPVAPFTTNQRDFLANVYYGMADFELAGRPDMRLRVVPLTQEAGSGPDRFAKIRDAVADGEVVFQLETAAKSQPDQWIPLVRIRLISEVMIDDRTIAFWPFRTGQGIRPEGFVQFLRPVPYLASQWARATIDEGEDDDA